MKFVDDYGSKLEIWASEGRVYAVPSLSNLPYFGHKKFKSHEEMNVWKKDLLIQLVETGGAKWKK